VQGCVDAKRNLLHNTCTLYLRALREVVAIARKENLLTQTLQKVKKQKVSSSGGGLFRGASAMRQVL
jgi:hypothetical protein